MKTSWPSKIRASTQARGFVRFLQEHYESRRARNPRYSLRAFASYLGLDHSTLSQILRGRRTLTDRTIVRIGERLGLSEEIIGSYLSPGRTEKRRVSHIERESRQLALDTFEVISDWHHFALLELTHVKEFKPDSRWIARALGITTDAVNIAISRLTRLRLLAMREDGRWEDRSPYVTMSESGLTDVVLRRMHTEAHELAIAAVERTPEERREQTSMTVALDSRRLPEITELIARFRRELEEIAGRDDEKDDVYRIEVSVFPVTTLHHINEKTHG